MGSPTCPTCKGTGHKLLLVNRFNPVTETAFQETAGWGPCPDCHPKFEAVARKLAEQLAKKADAMDANLTDQGFWWLAETVEKPTRYIADVPSCYGDYTPVATQARRWRTRTECADYCADSNKWRTLRVEPVQHGFTATPTPPAPADDASGAEAMRADFLAWVNAGYLVRDAVTDVEWDDEGLPLYYTRNDGVRHYLDGEWHAWQAARALPLPARREEAVVEAARAAVVRFAVEARNHGTFPVNECGVIDQTSAAYQSYIATLADLWLSVDAYTAAVRGAKGGDK